MTGRKARWIGIALVFFATSPTLHAQTDAVPGPNQWGQSVDDLQISLYLASEKIDRLGIPDIGLAIRNLGLSPQKVSLGAGCGIDTIPGFRTNLVHLTLTNEAGRSQELQDVPGPCGGIVGVFKVDVAPGATFTIPIDLDCYYIKNKLGDYAWAGGGTYSVRAVLDLRDKLENLTGQMIRSNDLRVQFPTSAVSHRCLSSGAEVPCKQ